MVNVTSSSLPCGRLAVARRTSFGRPYEAENWLNESDIVVGIVRRLRGDIDHEETHSLRCF